MGSAFKHLRRFGRWLYLLMADRRVPLLAKVTVAGALVYLAWPADLIPDRIPLFGYADDLTVLCVGFVAARRFTPSALLDEAPAGPVAEPVWVLTDDRIGNSNQSLGVAERFGRPLRVIALRYDRWVRLPNVLRGASLIGLDAASRAQIEGPWPRLAIGTGRRLAPVLRYIKMASGGRTRIIQIMDPEAGHTEFDLLVVPEHDRRQRRAANVLQTVGAPNRVTPDRLAAESVRWSHAVAPFPKPRIAVFVGGDTRFFRFDPAMAAELAGLLSQAAKPIGASLLVTTSRRTSPAIAQALTDRLDGPVFFHRWTPEGVNPFFGFLGLADFVVVTGDSMSMCTEACSSGKPVYIYAPPAMTAAKYQRLHRRLYDLSLARPFAGAFSAEGWTAAAANPTDQVAAAAAALLGDETPAD